MKKRWRVYFDLFEGPVDVVHWAYIEADDYSAARDEVKRILDEARAIGPITMQLNKIVPENEPSFEVWMKDLAEQGAKQQACEPPPCDEALA
jgi:hypothetical protein